MRSSDADAAPKNIEPSAIVTHARALAENFSLIRFLLESDERGPQIADDATIPALFRDVMEESVTASNDTKHLGTKKALL